MKTASIELNNKQDHASKIYLTTANQFIATFIQSDSLRNESHSLINYLHQHNKKIHLMSGDRIENKKILANSFRYKAILQI